MDMFKNICALIVTFHPNGDFPSRVSAVSQQVSKVIIVDNASNQEARNRLKQLEDEDIKVHCIWNEENKGVAAAINQGFEWARNHHYEWILTLDQDSTVKNSFIETLMNVYQKIESKEKIAIVATNYIDPYIQQIHFRVREGAPLEWIERKTVITSGSLILMSAYNTIGPFRDDFFIDGVDNEYCLRARAKGFKIIFVLKLLFYHPIGQKTKVSIPFLPKFKIILTNHNCFRWFYISRNQCILTKEYFFKDFFWASGQFIRLCGLILIMVVFEKNRFEKIRFVSMGLWDGVRGKMRRHITVS